MNAPDYLDGWAAGARLRAPVSVDRAYVDGYSDGIRVLARVRERVTVPATGGMREPDRQNLPDGYAAFDLGQLVL